MRVIKEGSPKNCDCLGPRQLTDPSLYDAQCTGYVMHEAVLQKHC